MPTNEAPQSRYHHLSAHHGVDLFEAAFSTQTFPRHAHEGFSIGAITDGAGGYRRRGETMLLPRGTLSLMNPEEPHTGYAAAGHVRYKMLYASEAAVRAVLGLRTLRGFSEPAPRDHERGLTRALARLAACLQQPTLTDRQLATGEALHAVLSLAFCRYGRAQLRPPGREPAAVRDLRARIEEGVLTGEDLSLARLSAEIGLAPSYLIRSTARATGLTPHGHVLRARLAYARRLLLAGTPAAEAALSAGFCDQSHLIRQFQRHYGVTPGALIRHLGPPPGHRLTGQFCPRRGASIRYGRAPAMSFKPVIIMSPELPPGLKANFAGVLAMSLGQTHPELIGPATPCKDGALLPGLTTAPLPVLGAPAEQLPALFAAAEALPLRVAYTRAAFEARDYDSYTARVAALPLAEHEPLALLLAGPRKAVDRICGGLSLLR